MKKLLLLTGLVLLLSAPVFAQKVIAEKAFTVAAGGYTTMSPLTMKEPFTIKGRFRAQGGSRNDVEMFVFDADGYENWVNGNQARVYYQSGKVTVTNFEVRLPAGTFYIVFNNRFSVVSNKAVTLWYYE